MNAIRRITKSLACVAVLVELLLIGCSPHEENAKQVWLYEYHGLPRMVFYDVVIYEKRTGYIKFKTRNNSNGKETVIEHSGRYTIEN